MDVKPLPCVDCKYPGFRGCNYSCRHPEHPEPINGKRILRILQNGGKCGNRVDYESKVMAGKPIPWPLPVSFMEV